MAIVYHSIVMATTIQVDEKTLKLLKQLKGRLKVKTYDALIRKLLSKKSDVPESMFGVDPGLRPFSEEDRLKFHDEI